MRGYIFSLAGIFLMLITGCAFSAGNALSSHGGPGARSPFKVDREAAARLQTPVVENKRVSEQTVVVPDKTLTPPASYSRPVAPVVNTVNDASQSRSSEYRPVRTLVLRESTLLSQNVSDWASASGFRLLWNSHKDFIIYSTITLSGTTADDILNELGKLFRSENYGLVIRLYEANNVLVIDSQ